MGNERVAGVVFYLEESTISEAAEGFTGRAKLSAKVTDVEMWEAMVAQLAEGLSLYRGKDFKSQLIEMLQEDQEALKIETERKIQNLIVELERHKQTVDQQAAALITAERLIREQSAALAQYNEQINALCAVGEDLSKLTKEITEPK